jgi:hypothetical protein
MSDAMTNSIAAENTRLHPRYPAESVTGITGMRLSPGDVVKLVNISASGVLVEGKTRFVPGTHLTVHFEGQSALGPVKGRVVRCQVSAIGEGGGLQYQSAIVFDSTIDVLGVLRDEGPKSVPVAQPGPASAPTPTSIADQRVQRLRNRW